MLSPACDQQNTAYLALTHSDTHCACAIVVSLAQRVSTLGSELRSHDASFDDVHSKFAHNQIEHRPHQTRFAHNTPFTTQQEHLDIEFATTVKLKSERATTTIQSRTKRSRNTETDTPKTRIIDCGAHQIIIIIINTLRPCGLKIVKSPTPVERHFPPRKIGLLLFHTFVYIYTYIELYMQIIRFNIYIDSTVFNTLSI